MKLKTLQYLEPRLGETMEGRISGVIPRGLFIELEDVPAEGFVPIDTLPEDWYVFDEETLSLRGEDSGLVFRLAQEVKVRLISCDTAALEMTLAIVEEGLKRKSKKQSRSPWGAKGRGKSRGRQRDTGRGRGKGKGKRGRRGR